MPPHGIHVLCAGSGSVPSTTETQSELDVFTAGPAESVRCDTDIPAEPVIKCVRIAKRAQVLPSDGRAQLVSNRGDPALLGCAGYRVIGCQIGLRATNPKAEECGFMSRYGVWELARRVGRFELSDVSCNAGV